MDFNSNSKKKQKSKRDPGEKDLLILTITNKYFEIKSYLHQHRSISLTNIRDFRNYTRTSRSQILILVLQVACLNDSYDICELFLDFLRSTYTPLEIVHKWINSQDPEGFTALHLCAFNGNLVVEFFQ